MKRNITLIFAFLITCLTVFGQRKQGYDNDSRWFWTANYGVTWSSADVKYKSDFGYGLTIGKSFNYNYGKAISFDIRGRFLTGKWYGQATDSTSAIPNNSVLQNYKDSLGFAVLNHWTRTSEVSLELVLHLNKLRENTGWDLYAFGGVGIVGFKANGDLRNQNDNNYLYKYDKFSDLTQSTLNNELDGSYETTLDGSTAGQANIEFMPSLGFGIGYQLAPRWSVGLEHKTTFTRLDYWDGYNNSAGKYENDWYHYTSAYTRFHLKKRNHGNPVDNTNDIQQAPEVVYTQPNVSGTTVTQPNYTIKALVKYINGRDNINFRQNGNYVGTFSYNASTDNFESNVVLQPGQNIFEIIASNAYGTDQETTIINLRLPQEAPPVVSFVNPSSNPQTVSNPGFNLIATVLNVQNASQISMTVNGQSFTNFNFNPANGNLTTNLNLTIGSNVVTITGTNSVGSDTETTTIIYNPVQNVQPPVVYFTNPATSPITVTNQNYTLNAKVLNVAGRENITFKQNGSVNQNFTYNANSDDFQSAVILVPGQNVFEIIASNAAGNAQATTIIILERVAPKPPVVTITNPATSPFTTENNLFALNATVLNVTVQSQVKVTLNGQNITNFIFTPGNNNVSTTLNLIEGTNTAVVTGTNDDGTDSKQVIIIYRKPVNMLPPLVTFTAPATTPTTVDQPSYKVSATVLNVENSSGVNVNFNGVNFTNFNFNATTKILSMNLALIEGVNVVVVTGTNTVGVDSKTTTIIYKKADVVLPPVVTFVDPLLNPLTVFNASYALKARIQNISGSQNITLKINGVASNSFTYNASTQLMDFSSGLIVGANIFEVTASNVAGQDSKSTTIIFKQSEPLLKPVVTITTPLINPYTSTSATTAIEATVLNVEGAQNISVLVNGAAFNGFSFNQSTKKVSFSMSLIEGSNTLTIKGTNAAGEAQDSRTILYKKETIVYPPKVTFINPSQAGTIVTNSNYTIKANILNIDNITQIIVNQNGLVVNASLYSFNPATKELIFNTGLTAGNNLFTITATNSVGTHSATINIVYNQIVAPCEKPVITFLNPNASGIEIAQSNNAVKLKVLNVTAANQIQVLVNGVLQNPGTFNGSNKIYDLNVNYTLGQNIIEVIATNSCGETKANTVVVYKQAGQPCAAPIIQLIQPINMESTVDVSSIEVRVGLLNITNQSQIVFKVNGVDKQFTFNNGNHILIANVDLIEGLNTINIQASNDCGSGGFPVKITRKACKKPIINVTASSVAENATTVMETITLEGNVTDVEDASGIAVTQNGLPINFVFNANQKTFSITANLKLKSNIFEIKATNSCGQEIKKFTVVRIADPSAVAPKITITNPASSPFNTNVGAFNVQATTQFVTAANQVSLTVNGSPVNANFNLGNGSMTYNLTLVEGNNVIVATAVNQFGSSSDTKTIVYTKPKVVEKPVIVLTQPGSCPATMPEGTNIIMGYILNITDLNQVSIKINGVAVSNFNPILVNGKLNFQFTVNMSSNNNNLNIEITAQNEAGSDAKSCFLRMNQITPVDTNCKPVVSTTFTTDSRKVTVTSTKDLSNVVLKFFDGTVQKFEGLTGKTGSFQGTGTNAGKCIVGIWVKSGCNESTDGPGYGEYFANTQNVTNCAVTTDGGSTDCKPTVSATFTKDSKSATAISTKDLINVVLKFYDGQEQKFEGLSGKTTTLQGTGANAGKCIVGVWIKSGCNQSNDGPNYGEYVNNAGYTNQCSTSTEPCGPRFNPGNSTSEFCLITPSGTYTRDNLLNNPNFTYSGTATSAYFTAIAGGGNVMLNGAPFLIQPGTTYLFTGTMTVEVKNPNGAGMGHWIICIQTNTPPTFGTGNNKPTSPCATANGNGNGNGKPNSTNGGGTGGKTVPTNNTKGTGKTIPTNPQTPRQVPTTRGGGK
ncbi:MAG: hypothetical protein ACK5B9_00605 [Flavobacteriia bacterium]